MHFLILALALALIAVSCTPGQTTPSPRPTTTLESFAFAPPTDVQPTDTQTPTLAPSETTAPTATTNPTPPILWVCVDLAYGRDKPDEAAAIVFQMSQQDRWTVTLRERVSGWCQVESSAVVAWMLTSDLCSVAPPSATATQMPTSTPPVTATLWTLPTAAPVPTVYVPPVNTGPGRT